ncbi:hypothetical protein ACWCXS_22470 [Streptomyces sp. NPDC001685]
MLEVARRAGRSLGVTTTGAVGDANLIAGTGVPTPDGLGPVGAADHTLQEELDLTSVPQRVALLAAPVAKLGDATDTPP